MKQEGYWFYLDSYVFPNCVDDQVLLYNTLDGSCLEAHDAEISGLIRELLNKENAGVVFLSDSLYQKEGVHEFIDNVRAKFMGDLIDVNCSQSKPVQVLPYINYPDRRNLRGGFLGVDDILRLLFELTVEVDQETNVSACCSFMRPIPDNLPVTICVARSNQAYVKPLLDFVRQATSNRYISCSYQAISNADYQFDADFVYKVAVDFPVNPTELHDVCDALNAHHCKGVFTFHIGSVDEAEEAELLATQCGIKDYSLKPCYRKDNYSFFHTHVFLSKSDILSSQVTMKDLFKRHLFNTNDFGRLRITADGKVYANRLFPALGLVEKDSIYAIIRKEITEGQSWLRIRTQSPCDTCVYQWLCPSPSDYEIELNRPNLCLTK